MITWTNAAKEALDSYNMRQRMQLIESGADPDEVAADLKLHIEEDLAAAKIAVATREDVERLLGRMGMYSPLQETARSTATTDHDVGQNKPKKRLGPIFWILLCVAALPVGCTVLSALYWTPRPGDGETNKVIDTHILSVSNVVEMARAGDVVNGTGTIRFSGDPLVGSVALAGMSAGHSNSGNTYAFEAHGRLTSNDLSALRAAHFREKDNRPLWAAVALQLIPFAIILAISGFAAAFVVLVFRALWRAGARRRP